MTILLWMLAGCGCAGGKSGSDTCDVADSATTGFVECDVAAALTSDLAVEICGNGADEDGDGEVDESGCADAAVGGSGCVGEVGGLIRASADPSLWVYRADLTDELNGGVVGGLASNDSGLLVSSWSVAEPDLQGAGVEVVAGIPTVALIRAGDEEWRVDLTAVPVWSGGEESSLPDPSTQIRVTRPPEGGGVRGLDLQEVDGALLIGVATTAWLLDAPVGDVGLADEVAVATFHSDDELDGFGQSVLFLPDPSGDGVADVLVSATGTYGRTSDSAIYVFDGLDRGSLAPDDSVARITEESDGFGYGLRRAGDVDGDGSEDVVAGSNGGEILIAGPFAGTVDQADRWVVGGQSIGVGASVYGDDTPDVVVAERGGDLSVHLGPLPAGHRYAEDADYVLTTDQSDYAEVILADLNADGTSEIVAGFPSWSGSTDTPYESGLISVFHFSEP